MSLEIAVTRMAEGLEALTAAIQAQTSFLKATVNAKASDAGVEVTEAPAKATKAKAEWDAAAKKAPAPAAKAEKPAAKKAEAEATPPPADDDDDTNGELPSYDNDVKPLVLRVSREVSKEACISLLSEFGVDHATKLKPGQYLGFIERAKEELGE